jgi:hypothetical protein
MRSYCCLCPPALPNFFVFCELQVVSKESRRLVPSRTCLFVRPVVTPLSLTSTSFTFQCRQMSLKSCNYRRRTMIYIYIWLYIPLDLGRCSVFLLLYAVGMAPWTGSSARRKAATYTQNKRTQTSMLPVGFDPTIPVFERAKTVHVLDRAATVIGI